MNSGGSFGGWSDPGEEPDLDSDAQMLSASVRYERLDLIGVGGMGRVYEAYDRKLKRTVALKEVSPQLVDSPAARRLATEALLTAGLEHPGIVSVHDSGVTEDGRLFYTMQLVRGRSLHDRLSAVSSPAERLQLVRHLLDACHAVGYAHRRGVVHRDIKPANIVVGEFGETQVVDWGLARRVDEVVADGSSAGTAGFMSPESAAGQPSGRQADVYSLGASLREVIGSDAAPDLVAIANHALAADPADRYADAQEMAVDLDRFIDGRRVAAYEYSRIELLKRVVLAWRAPLLVGAIASLVLLAVGVSAWLSTTEARDRAIAAEVATRSALVRSDESLAAALEVQSAAAIQQGRLPSAHVMAAHSLVLAESPIARGVMIAAHTASLPSAVDVQPLPPGCQTVRIGGDGLICLGDEELVFWQGGTQIWSASIAATDALVTGPYLALLTASMTLQLRDRRTGELLRAWLDWPGAYGLVLSPDGRRLGAANGWLAYFLDLEDLSVVQRSPCAARSPATEMALSNEQAFVVCRNQGLVSISKGGDIRTLATLKDNADEPAKMVLVGDVLVGGSTRGLIALFDSRDGRVLRRAQIFDGAIDSIVSIRGLSAVAIHGARSGVRIWDLEEMVEVLRLPAPTRHVTSGGEDHVWVVGEDVRRWRLPPTMRPRSFMGSSGVAAVDISGDGAILAVAHGDGSVVAWDTSSGALRLRAKWQDRVAKWVHFAPGGSALLGHGLGANLVKRWSLDTFEELEPFSSGPLKRLGVFSDGSMWGVGYGPHLTRNRADLKGLEVSGASLVDAAGTLSGVDVLLLDERGAIHRADAATQGPTPPLMTRPGLRSLAVSETGLLGLMFADRVEVVRRDGDLVATLRAGREGLVDVALAPNGRWAAAGGLDGRVLLWDVGTERLVAELVGHTQRVSAVRFTPDSGTLFTGAWDGAVLRWDLADASRPAAELVAEAEDTWSLSLQAVLDAWR